MSSQTSRFLSGDRNNANAYGSGLSAKDGIARSQQVIAELYAVCRDADHDPGPAAICHRGKAGDLAGSNNDGITKRRSR